MKASPLTGRPTIASGRAGPAARRASLGVIVVLLAARPAVGRSEAPAPPVCEVGHVAPTWTPADWATLSPTTDRCLSLEPIPEGPRQRWFLCGGLSGPSNERVPDLCPAAPGGLTVGRGTPTGGDYPMVTEDGAVRLDCPGRYHVHREADALRVTLEAAGAGACPTGPSTGWGWGSTGGAMVPPSPTDWTDLLPPGLRTASRSIDVSLMGAGTLLWTTGPVEARLGGFDVRLGHDTAWNDLDVTVDGDRVLFRGAPLRFHTPLVTGPDGKALELGTWAHGWFDAAGGGLVSTLPVRLPAARACGLALTPGQRAGLSTKPDPPGIHGACRKAPSTPPDDVVIAPTWVALGWDSVPADVRAAASAGAPTGWQGDVDLGCERVCRAP